ncbi:MAG: YdcF family protein [Alphaproteobacteria bacterium]|nr:YdcF family protein [Alphaproteobacteria bacterium]
MKTVKGIVKILLISIGVVALIMAILAMTSAPFWIRYNMGMKKAGIHRPPDYIVVLGGGGMPSESGLMRCWYAAKAADRFPRSLVIVALPGDTTDPQSSINGMKDELILRGVARDRIIFEDSGTNTRAEALLVKDLILRIQNSNVKVQNTNLNNQNVKSVNHSITQSLNHSIVNCPLSIVHYQPSILLVTSPGHLYRAVLTFRKAGFLKVDGLPAFEKDIETDLSFNSGLLGGKRYVPDVGDNVVLRYKFWNYLEYELELLREYVAIGYYWLMGWI